MVRHLLVTNDFPPKIGGIQSYLWELWRRLPPEDFVVHTTPYRGDAEFDAAQDFEVIRSREPWLAPHPVLSRRVDRLASEKGAELVILDPAVPVGLIGPHLSVPYGVVLHGAEVTIPGRVPGARALLNRVLSGARGVIAAGGYPADEAVRSLGRELPTTVVPPGVDIERFVPLDDETRAQVRGRFGLSTGVPLVLCVSRLVPRKGMDTLVRAAAHLCEQGVEVTVAIAGSGRDQRRLTSLIEETGSPTVMLGRVDDDHLADLFGSADVFAMLCRSRWGGLEQEGFGIVFVEAAAAGVPQVAGRSGGAHEAVAHDVTGRVVDDPTDVLAVADAIQRIIADEPSRKTMATASRERAIAEFSYDVLVARLQTALDAMIQP